MTWAILKKIASFYGRFLVSFSAIGFYWRQLFWSKFDSDFTGQIWIVTGASGGIGAAIVRRAASNGAKVIAIARSAQKLADLAASAPADRVIPIVADLSLQSETERAADTIIAEHGAIDVLVNNVGSLLDDWSVTREGHETSFALNILNHYVLTEKLLTAGVISPKGVIINMASGGMYNTPLRLEPMNALTPDVYNGVRAYGMHKRAQANLTIYWQKKWQTPEGRRFYVMHPGWADTDGVKTSLPRFRQILKSVLRTAEQGADTAVWLAAVRPQIAGPEAFWFDRMPTDAHAYPETKISPYGPDDLAAYLAKLSGK